MRFEVALVLALVGFTVAQDDTTTESSLLPIGSTCNGFLWRCQRYDETVACLQRRADPTEAPPTSDSPLLSVFSGGYQPQDVCETGLGVDLGKCACARNCKNGMYVEDGVFDVERQGCVGYAGSTCTLLVPNCVKHGHCNLVASKCVCDAGYVITPERTCAPA